MSNDIDLKVKTTITTKINASVVAESGKRWKAISQAKGIKITQDGGHYGESITIPESDLNDVLSLFAAVIDARYAAKTKTGE